MLWHPRGNATTSVNFVFENVSYYSKRGCPRGVMVKAMDCGIIENCMNEQFNILGLLSFVPYSLLITPVKVSIFKVIFQKLHN